MIHALGGPTPAIFRKNCFGIVTSTLAELSPNPPGTVSFEQVGVRRRDSQGQKACELLFAVAKLFYGITNEITRWCR